MVLTSFVFTSDEHSHGKSGRQHWWRLLRLPLWKGKTTELHKQPSLSTKVNLPYSSDDLPYEEILAFLEKGGIH